MVEVTSELGYDGGAFFSPDGSQLIWRASLLKQTRKSLTTQSCSQKAWLSQRPWNCLLPMLTARMRDVIRFRRSQLGPLLSSRWGPRVVLKQPQDGGISVQHFHDRYRWDRTHASHFRQCVRFIPHVLARWEAHRLFHPIETTAAHATPTYSSPIGWNNACARSLYTNPTGY